MNYLLYDLAIAAVLVFFALLGRKRGFVLTLCGLLGMFVALAGAAVIADTLCEPVAQAIQPVIERSIADVLQEQVNQNMPTVSGDGNALSISMEQALQILRESDLYRMFVQSLNNALQQGVLDAVSGTASAIAFHIAREVARVVLFVVGFVVVLLGWKVVSKALDLACKLPVLSTINRTMGGVLGLAKGGLVVFIAVWLLKNYLPPQALTDTFLLKFFAENSPAALMNMI